MGWRQQREMICVCFNIATHLEITILKWSWRENLHDS